MFCSFVLKQKNQKFKTWKLGENFEEISKISKTRAETNFYFLIMILAATQTMKIFNEISSNFFYAYVSYVNLISTKNSKEPIFLN